MSQSNSSSEETQPYTNDHNAVTVSIEKASPTRIRRSFSDDFKSSRYGPSVSDDSGILGTTTTLDFVKIHSLAKLTEDFHSKSLSALTYNEPKRSEPSSRLRNLTGPERLYAKSLPGTPRRSIDVGYLNGNGQQNFPNKRRFPNSNRDSVSTIGDLEPREAIKKEATGNSLTIIFSCIYAVLMVVMGCVFYVSGQTAGGRPLSEIYNMIIIIVGVMWLALLQIDLHRYKSSMLKALLEHEDNIAETMSTTTETVCNQFWLPENMEVAYGFLRGRHSGSFYLKTGMAVFCFGHLINKGLVLAEGIMYYMDEEKVKMKCSTDSGIVLGVLTPLFSFYQLFMVFKYSNIVINRFKNLARFGLMHLIAACLCFWFNTIVEDALAHYRHISESHQTNNTLNVEEANSTVIRSCAEGTIFSSDKFQAIPYLYPFTIEYNIILAGVWFIVWQNIGTEHHRADPHHFERKISAVDAEVTYQSNLVISADCHSANKGLFAGLFLMLITIVTVIMFFIAITHEDYKDIGVVVYTSQEMTLCILAVVGIMVAHHQLMKMEINHHPVTFLDDVLLFIPLPFFFVNSTLNAMAEFNTGSYERFVANILIAVQVIIQTPCIIDGLRRCSNSTSMQYKKPGREVITFLIILNLSFWIVNTFEQKNVEPFLGQTNYYGETVSTFVGHTAHPLMLFYRFHSSVCLADIWKSAYEKGE